MSPSISARGTRAATEFDDDNVHAAGSDKRLRDFQGLITRVRLRDQQIVDVHAALGRIAWIQSMLHVDVGRSSAAALGLCHDVLAEGGLAGGLRAEDFGDAAARHTADTQGDVQRERAGRDRIGGEHVLGFAELHDRALAVALENIADGLLEDKAFGGVGLRGAGFGGFRNRRFSWGHVGSPECWFVGLRFKQ